MGRLRAVPDAPRRGVGLIRVSKVGGREDLASPEIQRVSIEDYARRSGIQVVEWVEALDESASRARSAWWPRLEQAVAQVEAGERDVVLVWKVSRAARHRRNWAVALDRIEVAGGTIESATEGLDTTTSTGRLARGMLAELAVWESEVKGEQWKEAHDRRRRQGLPHSGRPRFGYVYVRGSGYQPDELTGPILAEMYRRYLAGEGAPRIAAWLGDAGVATPERSRMWSAQAARRILDSGFGAGQLRESRGGTYAPGAHEPVIDPATWAAYQRARRLRSGVAPRNVEPQYVLSGLVRCGLCGATAGASWDRDYGPGYLYRCTAAMTYRTCSTFSITRAAAERAVLAWLREQATDLDAKAGTKTARQASAAAAKGERTALAREATRLEQSIERARGFLFDGVVTQDEYEQQRDVVGSRIVEIERRLDELGVEGERLAGGHVSVARELAGGWETLPVRGRRDALRALLRHVAVFPRGTSPRVVPHPVWCRCEGCVPS